MFEKVRDVLGLEDAGKDGAGPRGAVQEGHARPEGEGSGWQRLAEWPDGLAEGTTLREGLERLVADLRQAVAAEPGAEPDTLAKGVLGAAAVLALRTPDAGTKRSAGALTDVRSALPRTNGLSEAGLASRGLFQQGEALQDGAADGPVPDGTGSELFDLRALPVDAEQDGAMPRDPAAMAAEPALPRATAASADPVAALAPAVTVAASVSAAVATPEAAPRAPVPLPDSAQILNQIRAQVSQDGVIRVRLDPGSLGQVEIELSAQDSGAISVSVRAEQASVLGSLRADRDGLVALLREQGHVVDSRSLSFGDLGDRSAGQQTGQNAGQNAGHGMGQNSGQNPGQPWGARPVPQSPGWDVADAGRETPEQLPSRSAMPSGGGVDISV
ncbi:hypothetical protein GCM10011415_13360 [Salipiger pallidus]|uniref:Flagellar hook-length control protein-like C-terminal domain-containing protein n=2 Tax=Salipiger pallidus TaxID=1775170 RepID=A0A8J3EFZ4_9RHOB|nr:hypothetical protein GCM10011415_13360 [Salipiger pallidus]